MFNHTSGGCPLRLSALTVALCGCGFSSLGLAADTSPVGAGTVQVAGAPAPNAMAMEFNSEFLRGNAIHAIDLSRYALGNPVNPGSYLAEVYLNGHWLGKLDIIMSPPARGLQPEVCIDKGLLQRFGLDATKLPELVRAFAATKDIQSDNKGCLRITDISPVATAVFDPSELHLDVSIPQALIARALRGYVPPESWEYGVKAASVEYRFNSYHTANNGDSDAGAGTAGNSTQNYLGLTARANVGGGWQLTHNGSMTWGTVSPRLYQSSSTYAVHDITAWKSNVLIGDAYTDGQLFDSVGFRGIQLASDDRMLPESQRGFAPVIRGNARGNATVSVRQNGILLTEIVVPPGPFEINDLYPTGYGGNIIVTVTESDGSQSSSTVGYAAAPQLLRESQLRYQVVAGALQPRDIGESRVFEQATVQYGFNNTFTGNFGLAAMTRYGAALVGGSVSTRFGSLAGTLTTSRFVREDSSVLIGNSLNATYAVVFPTTRSNLSIAAYRYNSQRYYSLRDAAGLLSNDSFSSIQGSKARNRAIVGLTQSVADRIGFQLSGSYQTYWDRTGSDLNYQANLSFQLLRAQISLGVGHTSANGYSAATTQTSLSLNVPLDSSPGPINIQSNVQHDTAVGTTKQVSSSGAAGKNNDIGYSASVIQNTDNRTSSAGSISWRAPVASFGGTVSATRGQSQASVSVSGGVVVHANGITLAPAIGDTYGIVNAPEAVGAGLLSSQGVEVNERGYAIVPYLAPYQLNSVELDLRKVSLDVEMESTTQTTAPHAGSVIALKFKGRSGRAALIVVTLSDKNALPLGSVVTDKKTGQIVGAISQGGVLDARVESDSGQLVVSWGESQSASCTLDYALPPRVAGETFARATAVCKLASAAAPRIAPAEQPSKVSESAEEATTVSNATPATERRVPVLLAASFENGQAIQAGSEVTSDDGMASTTVATNGRIFMRLPVGRTASMKVRWGSAADQQCTLQYAAGSNDMRPDMSRAVPVVCAGPVPTQQAAATQAQQVRPAQ